MDYAYAIASLDTRNTSKFGVPCFFLEEKVFNPKKHHDVQPNALCRRWLANPFRPSPFKFGGFFYCKSLKLTPSAEDLSILPSFIKLQGYHLPNGNIH